MSAKPVYRYPPRSHAWNCPCDRCAPFRRKTSAGDAGPVIVIGFILIVLGFWPAMVWHGYGGPTGTAWRWDIHSTIAELTYAGIIGLIVFLVWLGKRVPVSAAPRPPKGRLKVEATPQAPPVCMHRNAVKVESDYWRKLGENVVWHCWCPDCDPEGKTPLPANFRAPCCGAEPGTFPGDGHLYNCPYRKALAR